MDLGAGEQRTAAWHAERDKRLTASAFGNALGCAPHTPFFQYIYSFYTFPMVRGHALPGTAFCCAFQTLQG